MSFVNNGHYVKITPGFYHGRGTKVEIDGVEIQELVDVEFKHPVDGIATLSITLYPAGVDIEGTVDEVKKEGV